MNQILDTRKIYVTPGLKRKKKLYKINFFLSTFLVCILFSCYIYAEYDKAKSEEMSKEILSSFTLGTYEPEIGTEENPIVIILDNEDINGFVEVTTLEDSLAGAAVNEYNQGEMEDSQGEYKAIAIIDIPSIELHYPILSRVSDELLKISPNKFYGPEPNEVGNFCIAGHNYRNSKLFSNVHLLEKEDLIHITDLKGRVVTYKVYDKYQVMPEDTSCTSQLTNGRREVTLITCTNSTLERIIIKASEI